MSATPRFFYTLGVVPVDGRPAVTISRTIRYESLDAALTSITNTLIAPPFLAHLPAEPEPEPEE